MRIKIVAITFFGIFNCIISSSHSCAAADETLATGEKKISPLLQRRRMGKSLNIDTSKKPVIPFANVSSTSPSDLTDDDWLESSTSPSGVIDAEWSESNPAHPDYSPVASPFPYLDYLILQVQSDETISAK